MMMGVLVMVCLLFHGQRRVAVPGSGGGCGGIHSLILRIVAGRVRRVRRRRRRVRAVLLLLRAGHGRRRWQLVDQRVEDDLLLLRLLKLLQLGQLARVELLEQAAITSSICLRLLNHQLLSRLVGAAGSHLDAGLLQQPLRLRLENGREDSDVAAISRAVVVVTAVVVVRAAAVAVAVLSPPVAAAFITLRGALITRVVKGLVNVQPKHLGANG